MAERSKEKPAVLESSKPDELQPDLGLSPNPPELDHKNLPEAIDNNPQPDLGPSSNPPELDHENLPETIDNKLQPDLGISPSPAEPNLIHLPEAIDNNLQPDLGPSSNPPERDHENVSENINNKLQPDLGPSPNLPELDQENVPEAIDNKLQPDLDPSKNYPELDPNYQPQVTDELQPKSADETNLDVKVSFVRCPNSKLITDAMRREIIKVERHFVSRFSRVQSWFVRMAWTLKYRFIKQLLKDNHSLRFLKYVLNFIGIAYTKDVVCSTSQRVEAFEYDLVPFDSNRSLSTKYLARAVRRARRWVRRLGIMDKRKALVGLVMLSGGAMIKRVYLDIMLIMAEKERQEPMRRRQAAIRQKVARARKNAKKRKILDAKLLLEKLKRASESKRRGKSGVKPAAANAVRKAAREKKSGSSSKDDNSEKSGSGWNDANSKKLTSSLKDANSTKSANKDRHVTVVETPRSELDVKGIKKEVKEVKVTPWTVWVFEVYTSWKTEIDYLQSKYGQRQKQKRSRSPATPVAPASPAKGRKVSAKKGGVKQSSVKKGSVKEGSVKKSSPKKGSPKQGSAKEGSPKKGSPKKGSPKQGSLKQGSAKEGSPKKGSPKKGSPKQGSAKEGSPKKGSLKKGSSKQGSLKLGSAKKGSAKQGSAKKGTAKPGSVEQDSDKKGNAAKTPLEPDSLDQIQLLPLNVTRRILALLPDKDLKQTKKVGRYWAAAVDDVIAEQKARKTIDAELLKYKEWSGGSPAPSRVSVRPRPRPRPRPVSGRPLRNSKTTQLSTMPSVASSARSEQPQRQVEPELGAKALARLVGSVDARKMRDVFATRLPTVVVTDSFFHSRVTAFGPHGRMLAASTLDDSVSLHDARTGLQLAPLLSGHRGRITCIAFHPDGGQLLTGSTDSTVRLWDIWQQSTLKTYLGHTDALVGVALDGDYLVSAGLDKVIKVVHRWSLECPMTVHQEDAVTAVTISAAMGTVFAGFHSGDVRMYDFLRDTCIASVSGHLKAVTALHLRPPLLASGSEDGSLRVWDGGLLTPRCLVSLSVGSAVRSVSLSPTHLLLCGTQAGSLWVWNTVSGRTLTLIQAVLVRRPVLHVACSQEGPVLRIVVGSETGVNAYSYKSRLPKTIRATRLSRRATVQMLPLDPGGNLARQLKAVQVPMVLQAATQSAPLLSKKELKNLMKLGKMPEDDKPVARQRPPDGDIIELDLGPSLRRAGLVECRQDWLRRGRRCFAPRPRWRGKGRPTARQRKLARATKKDPQGFGVFGRHLKRRRFKPGNSASYKVPSRVKTRNKTRHQKKKLTKHVNF